MAKPKPDTVVITPDEPTDDDDLDVTSDVTNDVTPDDDFDADDLTVPPVVDSEPSPTPDLKWTPGQAISFLAEASDRHAQAVAAVADIEADVSYWQDYLDNYPSS